MNCNIKKYLLQHFNTFIATSGGSAATMKKSYCNISNTATATSEKCLLQQSKKYYYNISKSFVATLKNNNFNNDEI
jgi:hypothetical protein